MSEKWPRLKSDYEGRIVRTLVDLKNGAMSIPAGTICRIQRAHGGLYLEAEACPSCGVRVYITKVRERSVELLGVGWKRDGN